MIKQAAFLTLIAILSGCASTDHVYNADGACLTCFNNPLTGEALNHEGQYNGVSKPDEVAPEESTSKPAYSQVQSVSYEMQQVKYNADINVDVGFIALKDEFNFVSEEEVRKEMGRYAEVKLRSSDYEWKVMPGVSYTMGSARELLGSNMKLVIIINKRSDQSSVVIAKFWPDNSVDINKVRKHLLARVKTALNS